MEMTDEELIEFWAKHIEPLSDNGYFTLHDNYHAEFENENKIAYLKIEQDEKGECYELSLFDYSFNDVSFDNECGEHEGDELETFINNWQMQRDRYKPPMGEGNCRSFEIDFKKPDPDMLLKIKRIIEGIIDFDYETTKTDIMATD
jgi:hypothetical protein